MNRPAYESIFPPEHFKCSYHPRKRTLYKRYAPYPVNNTGGFRFRELYILRHWSPGYPKRLIDRHHFYDWSIMDMPFDFLQKTLQETTK